MKILDLFCGAGGASMGLHRAFPDAEIIGVDINPQPHYPFKFIQDDWRGPLSILPGLWERRLDMCAPLPKGFSRKKLWFLFPGGYHTIRILSWLERYAEVLPL